MTRSLALVLTIALVLSLSAVALADDPPAVVFIDPVDGDNRVDVSRAGEEIDITGYVEYLSETFSYTSGSYTVPVLRQLRFFVDGVEDEDQFKNWSAANPMLSTDLSARDATGYEFLFSWEVPDELGFYQLKVEATLTIAKTGPFGVYDEEVVVEVYSDTVYVVPMAAPNVAEIILAYNDVAARYGERSSGGNFIQEVAHLMGSSLEDQSGTDFLGEAKEEWCTDADMYVSRAAYRAAVFNWLKGRVQAVYGIDHPFIMPPADYFADWPAE